MELTLEPRTQYAVLKIIGAVTLGDAAQFEATLTSLVRPELPRVLVDCTALESLDDAAVATLVNFVKQQQKEQRHVALYGVDAKVVEMLTRLGMAGFLPLCDSLQAALVQLGADGAADDLGDHPTQAAPIPGP